MPGARSGFRLVDAHAPFGDVALAALDARLELVTEFQLVFDQRIKPFTQLDQLLGR